jgi:uncharacterized coiled-coil protein SlyX
VSAPSTRAAKQPPGKAAPRAAPKAEKDAQPAYDERRRQEAEARKLRKAQDARKRRIEELEGRIAEREQAIRDLEQAMAAPGFYENREVSKPVLDQHQALMWEVGDLMHQWEELQHTDS